MDSMASIDERPHPTEPRMERVSYMGIPITIEWRKGDVKPCMENPNHGGWYMYADYGFIDNTTSPEEEELDVMIGDDTETPRVFLASLMNEDGVFVEYKVMLGFTTQKEARDIFGCQYDSYRLGPFMEMTMADLQDWVDIQGPMADKEARLLGPDEDMDLEDATPEEDDEDEGGSAPTGQTRRDAVPEPSLTLLPDPTTEPILVV